MKFSSLKLRRTMLASAAMLSLVAFSAAPLAASAAELQTQTVQLVPPSTAATCPSVVASEFEAFVYDGAINSFDVTISDASYVAIAASAGETFIPFNYMNRTLDAAGSLHMHINTPSVAVSGTMPVTLTLLSVRPDNTVCALTVSTSVAGAAPAAPASSPVTSDTNNAPASSGGSWPTAHPWGTTQQTQEGDSGLSIDHSAEGAAVGGIAALDNVCSTVNGALRLWTVLLAIYLLVVAATILAQPTNKPTDSSTLALGAIIVVPLFVLLGIWGYAPMCRVGMWVPVGALLIAGIGFILGFRNHPQFFKKPPSKPTSRPPSTPKPPPPPPPPVPLLKK